MTATDGGADTLYIERRGSGAVEVGALGRVAFPAGGSSTASAPRTVAVSHLV